VDMAETGDEIMYRYRGFDDQLLPPSLPLLTITYYRHLQFDRS
jgi:hypothetical protein